MEDLLAQLQTAVIRLFDFAIAVTGFAHRSTCGIDLLLVGLGAAAASGRVGRVGGRFYSEAKSRAKGLRKR